MIRICIVLLSLISLTAAARPLFPSDTSYQDAWKLVEQFDQKQRPQSALEVVNGIYVKAKREKNTVNYVKAVAYKLRLQQQVAEDDVVGLIADLREEAAAASFPERNILHAYLARTYLGYYNAYAYVIGQRTPLISDTLPRDITIWDANAFKTAIFREIDSSLTDLSVLKQTPIDKYRDLFTTYQKDANVITPTLFDGLANHALDLYRQLGRSRSFRILNSILDELDEDFPIEKAFAPVKEFVSAKFSGDSSASIRALHLYQELLQFHTTSDNLEALIDNDLFRLAYVSAVVHTEEGDSLYVRALSNLYEQYKSKAEGVEVAARLIELLRNSDPAKGHAIAEEILKLHPKAKFSPNVRNLKRDLERPEINMSIEYSVEPGKPSLAQIRSKNVDRVWMRIVEAPDQMQDENQQKMLARLRRLTPVKEWNQVLPRYTDYKTHSTDVKIPELVKKGKYVLLVSTDPAFTGNEQVYGIHPFWVTRLALVKIEVLDQERNFKYFVHDALTGDPVQGATVKIYTTRYSYSSNSYSKDLIKTVTTDRQGYFTFSPIVARPGYYESSNYVFEINTKNDDYTTDGIYHYPGYDNEEVTSTHTYFFTDRELYRPGQTIYFKGIIVESNDSLPSHRVVARKHITVKFLDANGQSVDEKSFTSNEFGSFNGTFTAPVGKLNGWMRLESHRNDGSVAFRVEEYKRPTFRATFDTVAATYKVGDSVVVTGNAKTFAGANLDGAKVQFRVTRVVYFPYWFAWWRPIPYGREVTIASGSTVTNADGSFNIGFIAKPDPTQSKANDPVFTYQATATITDISGETQTAQTSLSAAYYSLIGTVTVPEVIERSSGAKIVFHTTNVNDRPAASHNDVKIERLTEPSYPFRQRLWERSDTTTMTQVEFKGQFPLDEYRNEMDMNTWPAAEQVLARAMSISASGIDSLSLAGYKPGTYKITLITHDPTGKDLKKTAFFRIYDKQSTMPSFTTPLTLTVEKDRLEPGSTASFLLASSFKDALVYYEITSHKGQIRSEQIRLDNKQTMLSFPITEQDRGGVMITAYVVHDYRVYTATKRIDVPWTNKELTVKIETFRSKLKPGDKDEWRITLKGSKAEPVAAEMLAAMYDASLDEIQAHNWERLVWNAYSPSIQAIGISLVAREIPFTSELKEKYEENYDYGRYILQSFGLEYLYGNYRSIRGSMGLVSRGSLEKDKAEGIAYEEAGIGDAMIQTNMSAAPPAAFKDGANRETDDKDLHRTVPPAKLDQVPLRKNFNETAFFYPALRANDQGEITFSFTIPEALTTWRMMGYAHTPDLRTGYIEQKIVTQKELMVQPNVPRFVREGDSVVLKAKISNVSTADISGDVRLSFFDATTMLPYDNQVALTRSTQNFTVAAGRSTSASWSFVVPEGAPTLVYRIVAANATFSDGEEAPIPVLPNKMLVTETLPLNVRGNSTETYRFEKLATSGSSSTLRNHKLTLEMSSNPAWYAVQALPTLMEFPYECAEQVFNRFYANSIAFTLTNSSPRIRQVFNSWKGSKESLLSNLEKNEDLKQILLEETPWVLDGKDETERKHRLGILFDINTMSQGLQLALGKLREQQKPSGGWAWFPGMEESDYISQYIVTGFGKLKSMGVDLKSSSDMIERGVRFMDAAMETRYRKLKQYVKDQDMDKEHLGYDAIQYLYARSFFTEMEIPSQYRKAFDYWMGQAEKYWTSRSILAQSMIGLALHRSKEPKAAKEIIVSLKERALQSKELGMYWKYTPSWFWYELPIESQAAAIELFDEVAKDQKSVEEMKIWLLKQKQVNDWKTTTATADACYALLGRGSNLLASTDLVKISLGGKEIDPKKLPGVTVEEGTGYFRTSWNGGEIKPELAEVKLTKTDDGIAWGAMYWQYFERLDKITPAASPLSVAKKLYRKTSGQKGQQLEEITENSPIRIGDVVTSRITIKVDRDMEYIHLKDMRGASFEPASQLSGFHYSGGLGYYLSIKDASTNFFINYLRKGVYVLEYDVKATHGGTYLGGITTIQSMYAPEFASHSQGITVSVTE